MNSEALSGFCRLRAEDAALQNQIRLPLACKEKFCCPTDIDYKVVICAVFPATVFCHGNMPKNISYVENLWATGVYFW